jgi:choline dehydrogenase-like flavoprotein
MLPKEENFVELDKQKVDAWGIPVARISCAYGENEKALVHDMSITAAEMLAEAGAHDINPYTSNNPPGLVIHEMGTARMGKDPKTSVLNAHNQSWDVPNLFVTDGAVWRPRRVRIRRSSHGAHPRARLRMQSTP